VTVTDIRAFNSPAKRLYQAITHANSTHSQNTMFDGWRTCFKIYDLDTNLSEEWVSSTLAELRGQLELTRIGLSRRAPDDLALFDDAYAKLRRFLSVTELSSNWEQLRTGLLTPDVMTALRFAKSWVEDDQREVDNEEISELVKEIDALGAAFAESDLPSEIRDFCLARLHAIRSALGWMPVSGAGGLERAVNETVGAFTFQTEKLRAATEAASDEPHKNLRQRFAKIIGKSIEMLDKAGKVDKGIAALQNAWSGAQHLLSYLPKIDG
jgi:hypothetical protein